MTTDPDERAIRSQSPEPDAEALLLKKAYAAILAWPCRYCHEPSPCRCYRERAEGQGDRKLEPERSAIAEP